MLKYRPFLLLPLIVAGFIFTRPAHAADPPLSSEDYWQKMQETQKLVDRLADAPAEAQQEQLAALADQWEHITQVTLPDGTPMAVNHHFLVTQLRATPPDLTRLNDLLTTLLAARHDWPQAKHSPGEVEIFSSILARPEFQWQPPQPSLLEELWRQFWRRFWEFLTDLLPEQSFISLDNSFIRYGLTALAVLALLAVLVFILQGVLADLVAEIQAELDAEASGEILTAETALRRAQTLSGAGDYRTAVRYLYLSSLLLLEERGLFRYDRSQTNREYLRSLTHLPKLAAILQEVIEVFDRVWYGYQPLDETTYAQYAAQVAKLRQQK